VAHIHINDVDLYYEEHGTGDSLVMVHGSWVDHHSFDPVVPGLAESFRVVTYDLRGHSRSEHRTGPLPRRRHEDDLAELIVALEAGPATVAANSYGASIALGLATRRPELVAGIVGHEPPLVAAAMDHPGAAPALAETEATVRLVLDQIDAGDAEEASRRFVEQLALGPGAWNLLPEEMRRIMVSNAPSFAAEQRDPAGSEADLSALLPEVPVLLTQGDQSPGWFSAIVAAVARSVEHAEVHTIAGAGHAPQLTHPAEYVEMVSGFAARYPAGARRLGHRHPARDGEARHLIRRQRHAQAERQQHGRDAEASIPRQ
jgi:pimeloyl-ACP methyl ester carboxylesterase